MENNIPQEAVVLAKEAEEMMVGANRYKITTATEYTGAAEQLKLVKAKAKDLDTTRKNLTQPIDESKKRIMDFFRAPLQFLADAEAAIKKKHDLLRQRTSPDQTRRGSSTASTGP